MSAEAYQRQINIIDQDIARLNARIADLQKQIAHKEADRVRVYGYLQQAIAQEKKKH
ncbi:MAG: hypothetical protein IJC66_05000 [Kiritimatiellae bacterium]|nr:hypothetical protein [Kiritimatiellia bacterium]MBQ3097495.1 hypothetical protein [Kiritimatiellia bacterium]